MKRYVWVLVLLLSALPALAQDPADDAPGMLASYALGDLALHSLTGLPTDPVSQLKTFFIDVHQPLNRTQEKSVQSILDARFNAMKGYPADRNVPVSDEVRKMNRTFFAQIIAVLTPGQQAVLTEYQSAQIKLRGGFEALKLALRDAHVPMSVDQEKQAESIYAEVDLGHAELVQGPQSAATVKLNRTQREQFEKIARLLTPQQRQALIATKPKG